VGLTAAVAIMSVTAGATVPITRVPAASNINTSSHGNTPIR